MSIKTNIVRVQTEGKCFCYRGHSDIQLSEQDCLQIQSYLEGLDNNLIYVHPLLYANNEISQMNFKILLSKGELVSLKFQLSSQPQKIQILDCICTKILKSMQFLPYRKIKTYFNPFEQKNGIIPGLYLQPVYEQTYAGLAFLPINLVLQPANQISSSKILLNFANGRFYQKSQVVRVDKIKNLIHFRNGEAVQISNLRKGKLKDISGYHLAQKLRNYFERTKQSCKQFFINWKINLEVSFFSSNAFLIGVGTIEFRDRKQKSLNQIVYPMARNSYNHNFRQMFKDSCFEGNFEGQLSFIVPNSIAKDSKRILQQFQKLGERMKLKLKLALIVMGNLDSRQEMANVIGSTCRSNSQIYILITNKDLTNNQEQNVTYFKQQLINLQYYFHILAYEPQLEMDELDLVALRNMAIIYCKMRQIPWKIKNIPFGDRPSMACSIDVEEVGDGRVSIALVGTMNAFFSKFCCYHAICQPEKEHVTIYSLIQQALNKFCSVHKIYPFRVFVFRTGRIISIQEQYNLVRTGLANFYTNIKNNNPSTITYIPIKQTHPLRTFIQTDENYVSRHTVKKTQLLSCITISNRYYLQLEFDEAPLEIQVYQPQNDPSFMQKVHELLAKLCYGSVGNSFGKGLGFIGFGSKLNTYKQYNLAKWQRILQDGVMLFL